MKVSRTIHVRATVLVEGEEILRLIKKAVADRLDTLPTEVKCTLVINGEKLVGANCVVETEEIEDDD